MEPAITYNKIINKNMRNAIRDIFKQAQAILHSDKDIIDLVVKFIPTSTNIKALGTLAMQEGDISLSISAETVDDFVVTENSISGTFGIPSTGLQNITIPLSSITCFIDKKEELMIDIEPEIEYGQ